MKRNLVLVLAVVLVAVASPGSARADDIPILAQVIPGSRTITTATLTPFSDVLRAASVNSELVVTVTEAAVSGLSPWSVTARLCGPDGDGMAPDCAADPDRIVLSSDTTKKITGANLTISDREVVPVLGGGTAEPEDGSDDLSTARTIFTNTGQDPLLLYTGTYASTSTVTLTPSAGSTPGAYAGYLVVTLVS